MNDFLRGGGGSEPVHQRGSRADAEGGAAELPEKTPAIGLQGGLSGVLVFRASDALVVQPRKKRRCNTAA